MGILTERATDIFLTDEEFCEAIGYLATPGRLIRIEAQVPYGKEDIFENNYPGQDYYSMLPTSDKQSFQLRIMLNNNRNCPPFLASEITYGGGFTGAGCISRGLFVERIVEKFGFKFTIECQNIELIRSCVQRQFPEMIAYFERGYNTPL